jgi:dTMP kinase
MKGAFFCLEGIDGCGKSTQINLLMETLPQKGYQPLKIREPGGTEISEKIRNIILSPRSANLSSTAELLLYNAARAQLIHEIIRPALEKGKIILADRYLWSTIAYQGYGRGLNLNKIYQLQSLTCEDNMPLHTFLLDITVEEFRDRSERMGKIPDRMEQEKEEFFQKVRNGYLQIASENADYFTILDGTLTTGEIHEKIMKKILQELKS